MERGMLQEVRLRGLGCEGGAVVTRPLKVDFGEYRCPSVSGCVRVCWVRGACVVLSGLAYGVAGHWGGHVVDCGRRARHVVIDTCQVRRNRLGWEFCARWVRRRRSCWSRLMLRYPVDGEGWWDAAS